MLQRSKHVVATLLTSKTRCNNVVSTSKQRPCFLGTLSEKHKILSEISAEKINQYLLFDQPFRIQNTWLGDPARLAMLETVIQTVEKDNLLERTREAGKALMTGIYNLAVSCLNSSNLIHIFKF